MKRAPRRILRYIIFFAFAIVIAGYSLYQARNLLLGPHITITSPHNGATVTNPFIEITGTARNITAITLNDRPIYINESGVFREQLLVPQGYTIMKLAARDKFGRSVEKKLELVYKPKPPVF